MKQYRYILSGPRWFVSEFKNTIKNMEWKYEKNMTIDSIEISSVLLSSTMRLQVSFSDDEFMKYFNKFIEYMFG